MLSVRPVLPLSAVATGRSQRKETQLVFCDQLQTLLAAGISLPESLLALRESERDGRFRAVLAQALASLETGQPLSEALAVHNDYFSGILLSMIRAAERTGALADALGRYSRFQRQVDEFRSNLWTAATYPLLLLLAGGAVVLFLLLYVVPRFSVVYADMHGPLPWTARLLLAWGDFAAGRTGLILGVLAAGVVAIVMVLRSEMTRQALLAWFGRLPYLGLLLKEIQLAHYFRSLGLLLAAGIPLIQSLSLSRELLFPNLRSAAASVEAAVGQGERLSVCLDEHQLVTPVALRLVQAGERSGQLAAMLGQAADFHDRRVLRTTALISRLIGPALMAVMGLVIGGIVVLLYMPIFQLAEGLG